MIDLTPLEVRKKKGDFRRTMRGYEPSLVDDFLDLAADRMEELVRENLSLHERFNRQEQQVAEYRERERALTEALVTAQEMREEIRRQSKREAELALQAAEQETKQLRTGAEQEAARVRSTAQQEVARLRAEAEQLRDREERAMQRLRSRQRQFLGSYRAFLERELTELGVVAQTLGLVGSAQAASAPASRHSNLLDAPLEGYDDDSDPGDPEPARTPGPPSDHTPTEAADMPAPGVGGQDVPVGLDADTEADFEPFEPEPFEPEPFEPDLPDAEPPESHLTPEDAVDASDDGEAAHDTDRVADGLQIPIIPAPPSASSTPAGPAKPERAPQAASLHDLTLVGSDDEGREDDAVDDMFDDDDDDDGEAGLLLRNAAAAGYRLTDTHELLLDTPVRDDDAEDDTADGRHDDDEDGDGDSWLPTLLDDQK